MPDYGKDRVSLQPPCIREHQENFLGVIPEDIIGFQGLEKYIRKGSTLNVQQRSWELTQQDM